MTIEAVIAYWRQVGFPEAGQAESVVARAQAAGFSFTERELRAVLEAREVLLEVREDAELREAVAGAEKPMNALLEVARRSGRELRRDVVAVLLGAPDRSRGELDVRELDQVAGGARFLPEVDDDVLVAFANGDTRKPYVIGSLWNDKDKPPT